MDEKRNMALNLGLKEEEYDLLLGALGRELTYEEIGIFSALWSEHCGYKYSAKLLKQLPTKGTNVLAGPGENAGAVSIDEEYVIVFKMESHNHPSAIAPFHGAATGVGGILRDVFTMGARPIAILDSLHFGSQAKPKNVFLKEKVVEGISFYGNCVGVPTVGGEFDVDECYDELPLVNVMAVGIAKKDELIFTKNGRVGALVIAFGAKTGRDGVHGAVFASDTKYDDIGAIQIADPFFEKLLIEASLELAARKLVLAMQDMGAAGLTSSSAEIAYKSGCGIEIDLTKLHIRDKTITPYEMLLSETQERMLAIVEEEKLEEFGEVLRKRNIEYSVIGELIEENTFRALYRGRLVADIPLSVLEGQIPRYSAGAKYEQIVHIFSSEKLEFFWPLAKVDAFNKLLENWAVDVRDIYERYDYMVGNQTVLGPGHSAAVLWLRDAKKAVAMTTDSNSVYSSLDAYTGIKCVVAESVRNLVSVGARPIAITNCLNFGAPERPEVYADFRATVMGLKDAAEFFGLPVVSGNVSFYNEKRDGRIKPSPVIGMVGLIESLDLVVSSNFKNAGNCIYEIGENKLEFGGSMIQQYISGAAEGPLPKVDLQLEKEMMGLVLELQRRGYAVSTSDVSRGGILKTILEILAISDKSFGVKFEFVFDSEAVVYLTSETQGRYLIEVPQEKAKAFEDILRQRHCVFRLIGRVSDEPVLSFKNEVSFMRKI